MLCRGPVCLTERGPAADGCSGNTRETSQCVRRDASMRPRKGRGPRRCGRLHAHLAVARYRLWQARSRLQLHGTVRMRLVAHRRTRIAGSTPSSAMMPPQAAATAAPREPHRVPPRHTRSPAKKNATRAAKKCAADLSVGRAFMPMRRALLRRDPLPSGRKLLKQPTSAGRWFQRRHDVRAWEPQELVHGGAMPIPRRHDVRAWEEQGLVHGGALPIPQAVVPCRH